MLSDFKICCPAFKIMLCELIYLCATLEYGYILLFRLASQRGLHPSRLVGCCSSRAAITRRQPFVATRPPGDRERPSLSLWATSLEGLSGLFRTCWGHRGPYWSPPSGTRCQLLGRTIVSALRINRRSNEIICLLLLEKINVLQFLFICLI